MRYRCCGVFRYSDSFISSGLNDNQRQKTSVGPCAGESSEDHVNRDAIPQAAASRDVALRSRIEQRSPRSTRPTLRVNQMDGWMGLRNVVTPAKIRQAVLVAQGRFNIVTRRGAAAHRQLLFGSCSSSRIDVRRMAWIGLANCWARAGRPSTSSETELQRDRTEDWPVLKSLTRPFTKVFGRLEHSGLLLVYAPTNRDESI
jgi:hypothetical protein